MPSRENSERVAHILGNYEIFEELGRGGMGIVYRGLDLSLDRPVAVKVLRDDLRSQSMIVNRFAREARAAASLDHPNIVQIYTVGDARDVPYIAMEFIDSEPLSALMIREGTIHWKRAFAIASQVASALASAHDAQIIHRDVKPPNILMSPDDKAYVTDFGIAKILSLHDQLTLDGTKLGTPQYMSPERCKSGDANASSDLYSLGVLLFQMISGRLPHEGTTSTELIRRILSQPPTRLRAFVPDIPEDVERLVAWFIERRPEHRPASATEAKDAIDRVLAGQRFDIRESAVSRAIADFRGEGKSSKHRKPSKRRSRRKRARRVDTLRTAIAVGAVGLAAVLMGLSAGAWIGNEGSAETTANREVSNWYVSKSAASFVREADDMWIAHLARPGMHVQQVAWDEDAAAFLLLTGDDGLETGDKIRRAVLAVHPASRTTRALTAQVQNGEMFARLDWGGRLGSAFVGTNERFEVLQATAGGEPLSAEHLHNRVSRTIGVSRLADVVCFTTHPSTGRMLLVVHQPTGEQAIYEQGAIEMSAPRAIVHAVEAARYSSDGTLFWFVARDEGDNLKVYAGDTAGGDAPNLVWKGAGTLSPGGMYWDGSRIVISEPSGAVTYVPLTGEERERVLSEGHAPAWAGDERVAYLAPDTRGTDQIWLASIDGESPPEQLSFLEGGVEGSITASRDGQWLAAIPSRSYGAAILFLRTASE